MSAQWIVAIGTAPVAVMAMTAVIIKLFKRIMYELKPNQGKSMYDGLCNRFDNIECRVKTIEKDIEFIREAVMPRRDDKGRYTK